MPRQQAGRRLRGVLEISRVLVFVALVDLWRDTEVVEQAAQELDLC
jgi:hypothetical protein